MKKILCLSLFLLSTQLPFSVYAINSNNLDSSLTSSGIPPSSFQCSTLDNKFNSLLKKNKFLKMNSKVLMSLDNAFTQDLSESRRVSTSIVQEGLKILQNTQDIHNQFNKALMKDENILYLDKLKLFEHMSTNRMKQIKEISKITREREKAEKKLFDRSLNEIHQAGQEYLKMGKEAANSFLNELKMKNEALNLEFKRQEKEALKKQSFFKKKREENLVRLSEQNRANLEHQKNELELEKERKKEEKRQERGQATSTSTYLNKKLKK